MKVRGVPVANRLTLGKCVGGQSLAGRDVVMALRQASLLSFLVKAARLKVALVLGVGAAVYGPSICRAQDAAPAVMDLILRKVAVETTKANGDSWDPFGGKPDLRVTLRCGTRRYRSPVKLDTFAHDFKAKALRVRAGDIVEIMVHDQDAVVDDEIGRIKVMITAEQIAAGRATWKAFGRVKELNVELRR